MLQLKHEGYGYGVRLNGIQATFLIQLSYKPTKLGLPGIQYTLYNFYLQFEVCLQVRENTSAWIRLTVGEIDFWIFCTLLLLCGSLFITFQRFCQRQDERAVEDEDLPRPVPVQYD